MSSLHTEDWKSIFKKVSQLTEDQLLEYMDESAHSSWEGYTEEQVTGVYAFLRDLDLYWDPNRTGQEKPAADLDNRINQYMVREQ